LTFDYIYVIVGFGEIMNIHDEHLEIKKRVTKIDIERIVRLETPSLAAEEVMKHHVNEACALIDSLDPLSAAFVILILRERKETSSRVKEVLERAEKLEIQGLKGLCHARDEVYRKTGVFLV
jgi:hypothetical protein